MTASQLYTLIYSKYGTVTRARNCFLYTKKGTRLTDLYQENGRAILGWDGKNASTFLKNAMNKGLSGNFCVEDKPRINKAVSALIGKECKAAFYNSKLDAVNAAVKNGAKNIISYRPWNKEPQDTKNADAVIIIPPFPWGEEIYILGISSGGGASRASATTLGSATPSASANGVPEALEGPHKLPYALHSALTRAIYNLIAELDLRTEKDWFIYDPVITKYWERKGPYLFPKISENKYEEFVKHCLECGIIINPDYNEPSIIPFGADKGVFTKLKNNPFEK